jgi:hypothetical protein
MAGYANQLAYLDLTAKYSYPFMEDSHIGDFWEIFTNSTYKFQIKINVFSFSFENII